MLRREVVVGRDDADQGGVGRDRGHRGAQVAPGGCGTDVGEADGPGDLAGRGLGIVGVLDADLALVEAARGGDDEQRSGLIALG